MRRRIFSLTLALAAAAIAAAVPGQQAAQETLASSLATWIVEFRDDAIERGVAEISPEAHEALTGFVPADVLDAVRWRVDATVGLIGQSLFFTGPVRAVTLDNVIVFANEAEARDLTLWAHELFHVMQYRQWGVEEFASRYLSDFRDIEHEAREFRWSWMKATGRVPKV